MSTMSRAVIDDRICTFAKSVRDGLHNFKPGQSWWVVKHTNKSRKYYPDAISFTDQLGVSEKDMKEYLSARWIGNIGSTIYTEYLRHGMVDNFYLVTVIMENPTTTDKSSSPMDEGSKVVMDDENFHRTRSSKPPWEMLRDIICGDCTSPKDAICEPPPSEKKKSNEIEEKTSNNNNGNNRSIDNLTSITTNVFLTHYWNSK
jgi:hypothetical protein